MSIDLSIPTPPLPPLPYQKKENAFLRSDERFDTDLESMIGKVQLWSVKANTFGVTINEEMHHLASSAYNEAPLHDATGAINEVVFKYPSFYAAFTVIV